MVRIRTIQVRLSRQEYDRIKNDSVSKGFSTLSSYLRYLALYRDQAICRKILEIHESVVGSAIRNSGKARTQNEILEKGL